MITFSDEEEALIAQLSVAGGWDNVAATPLKAKIKPYLLTKTSQCCCYCRRSMHGWHGLTIDPEHVLPKGDANFHKYIFDPKNLSVSCKRCNMGIKRNDTSFYSGTPGTADPFKSHYYRFIHPNLDTIDSHLEFRSEQHNTKIMVKYRVVNGSQKGKYAYAYFQLQKLELNSFDEAQDLVVVIPSESLPPTLSMELNAVLDSIEPPVSNVNN